MLHCFILFFLSNEDDDKDVLRECSDGGSDLRKAVPAEVEGGEVGEGGEGGGEVGEAVVGEVEGAEGGEAGEGGQTATLQPNSLFPSSKSSGSQTKTR